MTGTILIKKLIISLGIPVVLRNDFFVNNNKCIEAGYNYFSITKKVFKTNLKNRNVFSNIETECFVNFPEMLILPDFAS